MAARTLLLAIGSVVCFAANSLLCRTALGSHLIDPATFTSVRVVSAAVTLQMIVWLRSGPTWTLRGANPYTIGALAAYLVFFSFAYIHLSTGVGALILFAATQLTMFGVAFYEGESFPLNAWVGLSIAVAGLLFLVLPGASSPDLAGAIMMAFSGVAWGLFSLFARGAGDPLRSNAMNFAACIFPALALNILFAGDLQYTFAGLVLALASGAVASGLGYSIWYLTLGSLSAARAATLQLSVPAIAALGGSFLLAEPLTPRLVIASAAMLGGTGIALARRKQ